MSPRGDRLLDVAASISDAKAVNWDDMESSAKDKKPEALVRALRLVADVADAFALLDTGYFASDESTSDGLIRARTAAETALRFDEHLPEAHASLGLLFVIGNRPEDAETHFVGAIALSPNIVTARQWYSRLLSNEGRHDKAIAQAEKAVELDPISPAQHRNLGFAHYDARHYPKAIGHFQRTLELDPDFPFARILEKSGTGL